LRIPHFATAAAMAALISLSACGERHLAELGSEASDVQPAQVTPAELRAEATDERLAAFYEARGWLPVWDKDKARELVAALREAHAHALDEAAFLQPIADARSPAAREAAMSRAAFDFGEALARGRTDPERLHDVYELPRPEVDTAGGLAQAAENGGVRAWLLGLAPQDEEYRALSEAYLDYRRRTAHGEERRVEEGRTLRQGERDPRIPQIVEALRADGYLPAAPEQAEAANGANGAAAATPAVYTAEIAGAVRRLQEDYGVKADGVLGADTLALLNTGAFERARALAVNLERRRWLPRETPPTRIDVNTAAADMAYFRDNALADRRRVVVGQPDTETPALASPMFRLVANPTWTVPKSIEERDIAGRGEDYLRRNNMERRDGWIVQASGPTNALGLVKFDMKNDHAIYLHDTPSKGLFNENQRHYSAGCVRVQDALGFAEKIAADRGVSEEWRRARATGEETFVNLGEEIPVRLLYHTVFLDEGRLTFRTDPYGWDDKVAEALGLAARARPQIDLQRRDIGP
jgi:L,D-transpeptidase YcbB